MKWYGLPRLPTLLQKRLWHSCFTENFVKFLRASISIEHLWWLLPNAAPTTYATTANTNNTATSTTAATFVSDCVSYPLMYQVFLRTNNLLLHPLLSIRIWATSSLFFFSATPYCISYRALNRILNMVYELKQRKNICMFGNAIASQIILRTKFREIKTCSNLQVPKIKYR